MKRTLAYSQGSTVTELVVATLLASVIIGSLCGFYRSEMLYLVSQQDKTAALEDARGALDIMVRDLRNAGSWGSGGIPLEKDGTQDPRNIDDPDNDADFVCNRVYAATKNLIHVQMDLNGDEDCMDLDPRENIRYELTGPTSSCPGPYVIRRNGDCLIGNVLTSIPEKLFTYYDANGVELGDNPARDLVRRVKITFSVRSSNAGSRGSSLTSSVEFRN